MIQNLIIQYTVFYSNVYTFCHSLLLKVDLLPVTPLRQSMMHVIKKEFAREINEAPTAVSHVLRTLIMDPEDFISPDDMRLVMSYSDKHVMPRLLKKASDVAKLAIAENERMNVEDSHVQEIIGPAI